MSTGSRPQGRKWIRDAKRLAIYLRDGLACVWCNLGVEQGVRLSLDHWRPTVSGGTNEARNLVTACHQCNSRRQNMSPREFLTRRHCHTDLAGATPEQVGVIEMRLRDIKRRKRRRVAVRFASEMIASRGGLMAAVYGGKA